MEQPHSASGRGAAKRLSLPVAADKKPQTPRWTAETLYRDGDDFFNRLCESILSARVSVHLETYIFDLDALGLRVLDAMAGAAERGVKVKLLLDGVGSSDWNVGVTRHWRDRGIEIRFFHPLPWQMTGRRKLLPLARLNHRDHRKLCIIDGTLVFTGSMNVSARHLPSQMGTRAWRDTSVCVTGHGAVLLERAFQETWRARHDYVRKRRRSIINPHTENGVRLNSTEQERDATYQNLVSRLEKAQHRIWITNPYFVPAEELMHALCNAARNGLDVHMIFPSQSDFFGVKRAMESYYELLLKAGVKIHEYQPSMLHAKVLIIDDWVTVGSTNFDYRSLFQDLEVDVILGFESSLRQLEADFRQDLEACRSITLEAWKRRSFEQRWQETVFYHFRRFL